MLRQPPQQFLVTISQHLDFGGALLCFALHCFALLCQAGGSGTRGAGVEAKSRRFGIGKKSGCGTRHSNFFNRFRNISISGAHCFASHCFALPGRGSGTRGGGVEAKSRRFGIVKKVAAVNATAILWDDFETFRFWGCIALLCIALPGGGPGGPAKSPGARAPGNFAPGAHPCNDHWVAWKKLQKPNWGKKNGKTM